MNRRLTSRASTPSTPWPDCKFFYSSLLCTAIFSLLVLLPNARAQHLTGRIKGTVKVTSEATDAPPALLVGARLTLVNRDLTEQVFKVVTDDVGNFIFIDLPAATFVLTAEADGLATVPRRVPIYPTGLPLE